MKGKLLFLFFWLTALPLKASSFSAWNNIFDPTENQSASFRYALDQPGDHMIRVYTVSGELVREFGPVQGTGSVIWDGKNGENMTVAAGVYFVRISGPALSKTQKAIVVK